MIRLTVLYGHPTDPEEFDRYYRDIIHEDDGCLAGHPLTMKSIARR